MKFKKVEVSAFRIYDSPEHGTFDFTTKTGETANFVSLYAPNGFGKTSFYDAVEWGMTDTIGRLLYKKNKDLANSQYDENKLHIIRNNNSELNTYVNITDDNDKVRSQKWNVSSRRKFDLEFDNKKIKSFHKVVLSQEWISAFLKEDDGELRYEKFIKNPELIKLDSYYKNLIGLINVNTDNIQVLKKEIEGLKKKITITEESNLLDQINVSVVMLKNFEEKLKELGVSSSQKDILEFRNQIALRVIELEGDMARNNTSINSYNIAQNGNQDVLGLDLYFEKVGFVKALRKTMSGARSNLEKFEKLEKYANKKNGFVTRLEVETKKKDELTKLLNDFSEYERINREILYKSKKYTEKEREIVVKKNKLNINENSDIEYKSKIESHNTQIARTETQLKKLPELHDGLIKMNKVIEDAEKLFNSLLHDLKNKEAEIKKNEHSVNKFTRIAEDIRKYQYELIENQDFLGTKLENSYTEIIESVKGSLDSLDKLEKQKIELVKQIDQQKTLSSNISEFIATGLDIAKSIKNSNCPLCNHSHDSYGALVDEISSNKLLDELLQKLLKEEKGVDDNIILLKKEVETANTEFISIYDAHVLNLNTKSKELNSAELSSRIDKLNNDIRDYEKQKLEIQDKFGDLSVEELQKTLNQQLVSLKEEKKAIQYLSSKNLCVLGKRKEQIELITSLNVLLKKDIEELELNEKYLIIKNWFCKNFPETKIDVEILKKSLKDTDSVNYGYSHDIDKLVKDISELEKDLSSYKKEDLAIQEIQLKDQIEKETIKNNSYQDYVKKLSDISINEETKESLSKTLSEQEAVLVQKKIQIIKIKSEYVKLEIYGEIIEPYLQSEVAKLKLIKKENELSIWVDKVTPTLNTERGEIRKHLEDKIKNFFHTDLINEIYKRIDPHPDFKNVEFKADFASDNPRLDVFVTDKKLNQTLIPNLYFSTAQINILSLSIFLASALNSKEYDCILVDDPIQSLDSINVLSTIDLFRSIIVNQDKQIILSTHDENFHNLLKKKIPKELFKSKFLELESFGKVKPQVN